VTECARVILCDPESTGGLTAPGASVAPDPDADDSDGCPRPRRRTAHIGLDRRIRMARPSRVAIGGGTARADRAVGVSRAWGANRAASAGRGTRNPQERSAGARAALAGVWQVAA